MRNNPEKTGSLFSRKEEIAARVIPPDPDIKKLRKKMAEGERRKRDEDPALIEAEKRIAELIREKGK